MEQKPRRRRSEMRRASYFLPEELIQRLERLADHDYDSVSAQVRKAIIMYLKTREGEK